MLYGAPSKLFVTLELCRLCRIELILTGLSFNLNYSLALISTKINDKQSSKGHPAYESLVCTSQGAIIACTKRKLIFSLGQEAELSISRCQERYVIAYSTTNTGADA